MRVITVLIMSVFVCDNCGEVYYNTEKHCIEVEEDEVEYVCSHCHMNYINKE